LRKKIPAGSVFQRTYRDTEGKLRKTATWSIHYYANGKPVRIATGTEDRDEAISILREKLAKASRYADYSEHVELVPVNQLLDLVIEDYRLSNRSTTYDAELRIEKHLRPIFGSKRAIAVTTAAIKKYTLMRVKEAEPATVNRELAYLRRAFRLGFQNEPQLVEKVPNFRMLPLDNARTGILPHEKYRLIRDGLPESSKECPAHTDLSHYCAARKVVFAKIVRSNFFDANVSDPPRRMGPILLQWVGCYVPHVCIIPAIFH
jgi:hypothetical protein